MKRITNLLLILAVVLFTSACAGNNAAGQSAQSAQNVKTVSSKKNNFASIYLSNIDKDAETYVADFDLNQYLLDSGAISIERLDQALDSVTCIAARYPNGIVTLYYFSGDNSDPYGYGYLAQINIFVAEDGYNLNSDYGDGSEEDKNDIRSEWLHYFYVGGSTELVNDPKFDETCDFKLFTVKPNGIYYVEAKNGQKSLLAVPDYFDKGFKDSILPYINMKNPSFRKDPMEGKLRGTSDIH